MSDTRAVVVVKSLQIEAVLVGAANLKYVPYQRTCEVLEFGGNV